MVQRRSVVTLWSAALAAMIVFLLGFAVQVKYSVTFTMSTSENIFEDENTSSRMNGLTNLAPDVLLPDSISKFLSVEVNQRFVDQDVAKKCMYAEIAARKTKARARFNVTTMKPVVWTCNSRSCSVGLGDLFRGIASSFYQGLTVGFDMIANWTWPIKTISHVLKPRDQETWIQAEETARKVPAKEIFWIGWKDKLAGKLCRWTNFSAVNFQSAHNYKPQGPSDCDWEQPKIKQLIKMTSWSNSGIGYATFPIKRTLCDEAGWRSPFLQRLTRLVAHPSRCAFWHQFRFGAGLEQALASALRAFDDWKRAANRTHLPVVAVHVRAGDRHLGRREGAGLDNPCVARPRSCFRSFPL